MQNSIYYDYLSMDVGSRRSAIKRTTHIHTQRESDDLFGKNPKVSNVIFMEIFISLSVVKKYYFFPVFLYYTLIKITNLAL